MTLNFDMKNGSLAEAKKCNGDWHEVSEDGERWFRFSDVRVSTGFNEWTECSTGYKIGIILRVYRITKRTRCGIWLAGDPYGLPKFINLNARRHWAWPTIEQAWNSYGIRKERQVQILEDRLESAKKALAEAKLSLDEANGKHHFVHPRYFILEP